MLAERRDGHSFPRALALAEAVEDVAAELRLVDVVDLITFARTENHPNIGDLVDSSLELFFKPGALRYGWGADVELAWGGTPALRLDMEFRHAGVTVFFRLALDAQRSDVELNYVAFENASADPAENTRRLGAAVADARLLPPQVAA